MEYNELLEKENELVNEYLEKGFEIEKEFKNNVARFVTLTKGRETIRVNRIPIVHNNEVKVELQVTSAKKFGIVLTELQNYLAPSPIFYD